MIATDRPSGADAGQASITDAAAAAVRRGPRRRDRPAAAISRAPRQRGRRGPRTSNCWSCCSIVAAVVVVLAGIALRALLRPAGHPAGHRPGRPGAPRSRRATTSTTIAGDGPAGAGRLGRRRGRDAPPDRRRPAPRCGRARERSRGQQPARAAGRGADPVQPRPGAVRLRRLARPAGAAAQGGQLLPAAAAPLRRAARRAGRPVHRVRGRRRAADAAADQRPAGVLPDRPAHHRLRRGRPQQGDGRRGRASSRPRGQTPTREIDLVRRCRSCAARSRCSPTCWPT